MKKLLIVILVLVCSCSFAQIRGGAQYDPAAARRDLSNVSGAASLELSQRVRAAWAEITGNIYASGSARLEAGTSASPAYTFSSDSNTGMYSPAADTIGFSAAGAEAMRITSTGEVMIATSTDMGNYKLQMVGGLAIARPNGSGPSVLIKNADGAEASSLWADSNGAGYFRQYDNLGNIKTLIQGGGINYLNGGDVLIATSTDAGDYKLQVNGNAYVNGNINGVAPFTANEKTQALVGSSTVNFSASTVRQYPGSLGSLRVSYTLVASGTTVALETLLGELSVQAGRLTIIDLTNQYTASFILRGSGSPKIAIIDDVLSQFSITDVAGKHCLVSDGDGTFSFVNHLSNAFYLIQWFGRE